MSRPCSKGFQVDEFAAGACVAGACTAGGDRLVSFWLTIDQQGAAGFATVRPYLGQVGNWLLAQCSRLAVVGGAGAGAEFDSGVLFYRDGPRLAAFAQTCCSV